MSPIIELLIQKTNENKLYWSRDDERYITQLQANYGYITVTINQLSYNGCQIQNTEGLLKLNKVIYDSIEDRIVQGRIKTENSLIQQLYKL